MHNICVVIDNDFYNDPRVMNEVKLLSEMFNVYVLCFKFTNAVTKHQMINSNVYVKQIYINKKIKDILFGIQNTIPIYEWFMAYHIGKYIAEHNLRSIHLHDLYMSNIGRLVKKKTGVYFILDLHENYPQAVLNYKWTKGFFKKLLARPHKWGKIEGRLLSYPDKIIVMLSENKQLFLSRYSFLKEENFTIFPSLPDLDKFKSYPIDSTVFQKNDRFILLYYGIISARRGILTSIEAVKKLKSKYPNVHLLLIGPIDRAEESDFSSYMQDGNITHIKWIDISLLPSYASISDVCLNPVLKVAEYETTIAAKVYQYALLGKPQIVSDCKPLVDFVEENKCGIAFKGGDSDDLALKIEHLVNNPDECKEYGQNGKQAIEKKYNIDVYKSAFLSTYKDLT